MVVDTSALLAVLFDEPEAAWAISQLNQHGSDLRMSTVNLTETLIILQDRQPQLFEELEARLYDTGIRFVPPDVAQAQIAADARHRYPLNLGDCFAYALAVAEGCPLLAKDRDFRKVDIRVISPPTDPFPE